MKNYISELIRTWYGFLEYCCSEEKTIIAAFAIALN